MRLYDNPSNFTSEEFTCKCGCGFGSREADIDQKLILKLNMLRDILDRGLMITSGARCKEWNTLSEGVVDSAHLPHGVTKQCRAADVRAMTGNDRYRIVDIALKLGFRRIGVAKNFIHLDVAWDLPDQVIFTY